VTENTHNDTTSVANTTHSHAGLWRLAILLALLVAGLLVLSAFDQKIKLRKLSAKLYSGDPEMRMQAVWSLERSGKEGWKVLAKGARHESPATRLESIAALGRVKAAEYAGVMYLGLEDEDSSIRCESAVALARFPNVPCAEQLRIALQTEASDVARYTLALALLRRHDESGVPLLIDFVSDKTMGEMAVPQLSRLAGKSFGRDMKKWRAWWQKRSKSKPPPKLPLPKPFKGRAAPPARTPSPLPRKIRNEKDSSDMVLVPAGEFIAGSDGGALDERPERKLFLPAFYIDVHEVTCAQWQKFLHETGYPWQGRFPRWASTSQGRLDPRYAQHPVGNVSLADAQAYARWAGKRLPTEAEWEKAARGADGRIYPWGNRWPEDSVFSKTEQRRLGYTIPSAVGARTFDRSPFGVLGMGGGVREWTSSEYVDGLVVTRGGTCNYHREYSRCADRHPWPPTARSAYLGFRCAKDAKAQ